MAFKSSSTIRRCLNNLGNDIFSISLKGSEGPSTRIPVLEQASIYYQQLRWASKKQGGSTQNNKDSNPKYLGIKLYGGQHCIPGNIIVRQRGTEFHPGLNVGIGKDHTLFSLVEGHVKFVKQRHMGRIKRIVSVQPLVDTTAAQTTNASM